MIAQNRIHLFEEHSSTLPIWWAQRGSPATVVYLDAHLDLQRVADAAIATLRNCATIEEVRALEAPDHFDQSPRYAFGIENFLYAASRLELIDHLVWVAPPHIPRHYSKALIDYMQQMSGISFEELTGFRRVGRNSLEGCLLGLRITICDYDELDSLGIDAGFYLDIDIDYFVDVPADRLWIDPATVISKVQAQLGDAQLVTISRAVSSGFTPLAYRYLGDYIFSLLNENPADFQYYQELTGVILQMGEGDPVKLRSDCRRLTESRPELAPAHYILGLATPDKSEKQELLAIANKLDAAYGFDYGREAIGLIHRKKPLGANLLRQLKQSFNSGDFTISQRQQAELALVQVLAMGGNPEDAIRLVGQRPTDYARHEDALLAIVARKIEDPAWRERNREILKGISTGEKNAAVATLYLGDLEYSENNYAAALGHYQGAQTHAPAWMLPLERIFTSYQKLAMKEQADKLTLEIKRRRQTIEELLRQS